MKTLFSLTKRNILIFFKDKGLLLTSLITPMILLVLYATFLAKVYRDSFESTLNSFNFILENQDRIIDGVVKGQLTASILAVCCITVAFCSNAIMVQDRASGVINDLCITPVRKSTLSVSYFLGTFITTLLVNFIAMSLCFIYIAFSGWYLSFIDILLLFLDVVLLSMFGSALSCFVNNFLTSQSQIGAVSGIVSAVYGFICGAYMPIATFGKALQNILAFLPGTYGTALLKSHALKGALEAMQEEGVPVTVIENIKDGIDCNIYFFDKSVNMGIMYLILGLSIVLLIGGYILVNKLRKEKK